MNETKDESNQELSSITFTYKIAAEIGKLGDNINFLRNQIKKMYVMLELQNGFFMRQIYRRSDPNIHR